MVFMLGFIALLVGGLLWASRLRRTTGGGLAAVGLLAVAALGALAMLVGSDPFHDVFLVSSYAAWVVVGRGFDSLQSALTRRDGRGTTSPLSRAEGGQADSASEGTAIQRAMRRLRSGRTRAISRLTSPEDLAMLSHCPTLQVDLLHDSVDGAGAADPPNPARTPRPDAGLAGALTSAEDTVHMDGYSLRCPRCKQTLSATASTQLVVELLAHVEAQHGHASAA